MPAEIHYLRKTSRVGATYEHRARDWRFSRDQRAPSFSLRAEGELRKAGAAPNEVRKEAGIEDHEWEDRLPPMRPWMFWLAAAGSWAIFAGAFWGVTALLANA